MSLRTLIAALVLVAAVAFMPSKPAFHRAATSVQFKFLKDLGLEKPSWLPDFGGKKEEEEPVAVDAEGEATEEDGEAAEEE